MHPWPYLGALLDAKPNTGETVRVGVCFGAENIAWEMSYQPGLRNVQAYSGRAYGRRHNPRWLREF